MKIELVQLKMSLQQIDASLGNILLERMIISNEIQLLEKIIQNQEPEGEITPDAPNNRVDKTGGKLPSRNIRNPKSK